jgi:hypothetical protein
VLDGTGPKRGGGRKLSAGGPPPPDSDDMMEEEAEAARVKWRLDRKQYNDQLHHQKRRAESSMVG